MMDDKIRDMDVQGMPIYKGTAVCKRCGKAGADPDTGFCSPECMARDLEERTCRCMVCGREFITQRTRKSVRECPKCYYNRHYRATRTAEMARPAGDQGIDDALREAENYRQKTGKRLSYGEYMALKAAQKDGR